MEKIVKLNTFLFTVFLESRKLILAKYDSRILRGTIIFCYSSSGYISNNNLKKTISSQKSEVAGKRKSSSNSFTQNV